MSSLRAPFDHSFTLRNWIPSWKISVASVALHEPTVEPPTSTQWTSTHMKPNSAPEPSNTGVYMTTLLRCWPSVPAWFEISTSPSWRFSMPWTAIPSRTAMPSALATKIGIEPDPCATSRPSASTSPEAKSLYS